MTSTANRTPSCALVPSVARSRWAQRADRQDASAELAFDQSGVAHDRQDGAERCRRQTEPDNERGHSKAFEGQGDQQPQSK